MAFERNRDIWSFESFKCHVEQVSVVTKRFLLNSLYSFVVNHDGEVDQQEEFEQCVDWWNNTSESIQLENSTFHTCHCGHKNLDFSQPPFAGVNGEKSYFCCICNQHVCHPESECSVKCCLKCNPSIESRKIFKPCSFSCQRQRIYDRESYGEICLPCHKQYLSNDEDKSLQKIVATYKLDLPLLWFIRNKKTTDRLVYRELNYIGEEKLKYLIKQKQLASKFLQKYLQYEETFGDGADGGVESSIVATALGDTISDYGKLNHKIRPWKTLKILAKLIIIFKRYQEDFYNPDKGRFLKLAARNFKVGCKLLQSRGSEININNFVQYGAKRRKVLEISSS